MDSMEAMNDLVIVGAGPAGMTAAIYAARKALKVAVLADSIGGQVGRTGEIENYTGFQMISGMELVDRFHEHASGFDVEFHVGERVSSIARDGDAFLLTCDSALCRLARAVIVATGRKYRALGVPGEEELAGRGISYCFVCDAPFFRNKAVAVIGGGNAAFSAARDLLKLDAHVTMVNSAAGWQADTSLVAYAAEHPRAVLLDRARVLGVTGKEKVQGLLIEDMVGRDTAEIAVDGVFVEIGGIPNSGLVDGMARLNELSEIIIDCHCRTSIPGLFAAGDVTSAPYKQIAISVGEGAKAALSAYDYLAGIGVGDEGFLRPETMVYEGSAR